MKTFRQYLRFALPVVATVALLFSSCSSSLKEKEAQVPKNAYFVANVNLGTLWEKGDLKNIENLRTYSMLQDGLSSLPKLERFVTNLLKDPSSSGIDTGKDILFFVAKNGKSPMVTLTASLKNKKEFSDFLSSLSDFADFNLSVDNESDDGLVYATLDKDAVAVYNEKSVALVIATDRESRKGMNEYGASLFEMEESESLFSNSQFKEYWNNRKEIGYYLPLSNIMNDKDLIPAYAMSEMKREMGDEQFNALKNVTTFCSMAFQNGSIDMHFKTLGLPSNYKLTGSGIPSSLMRFMPDHTLAALSISVDMPALMKIWESNKEIRQAFNERIEGTSYTVKDLFSLFGGNLVASFYGMDNNGMPLFAVSADVKDNAMVAQLIESFGDAGIQQTGNIYSMPIEGMPSWLYSNGNTIAFTNDGNAANLYAVGGYGNGLGQVASKIQKGNYFYMDLNLHNYPGILLDMIGYRYDPTLEQVLSILNSLEIISMGDNEGLFRINLNNTDNSLALIVNLVDQLIMNEINHANRLYSYTDWEDDTYDYIADTVVEAVAW